MNKELINRLKAIMEYYKLSQSEFANRIGVRQPNMSAIFRGERTCGSGILNKVLLSFDIDKTWLLTGEGDMINQNASNASIDMAREGEAGMMVPLIPASAFAGSVDGFAPESLSLSNCERVVSPVAGAELALPITGDSMEPQYPNGSIAYIKRINEHSFIPWGHTVILDTENGAFIKQIYPDNEDNEYIWAKSMNTAYPPMHIPKASIYRIFRVLGTARIFTTM